MLVLPTNGELEAFLASLFGPYEKVFTALFLSGCRAEHETTAAAFSVALGPPKDCL